MSKIMTVDILSSIKGAQPSASVNQLFDVIKKANQNNDTTNNTPTNIVSINDLREDIVIESSSIEREIIIENFPKEKDGYLVVSKVIED